MNSSRHLADVNGLGVLGVIAGLLGLAAAVLAAMPSG